MSDEAFSEAQDRTTQEYPELESAGFATMTQYFLDRDLYVYPSPADTEFGFGGALSKVEFDEDTEGVTLIAPAALIDSPPSELVQADVSFATITPSRQLYCLDSMDPVVMPCSAPPLKELRSEARRDGKSNGSG